MLVIITVILFIVALRATPTMTTRQVSVTEVPGNCSVIYTTENKITICPR